MKLCLFFNNYVCRGLKSVQKGSFGIGEMEGAWDGKRGSVAITVSECDRRRHARLALTVMRG